MALCAPLLSVQHDSDVTRRVVETIVHDDQFRIRPIETVRIQVLGERREDARPRDVHEGGVCEERPLRHDARRKQKRRGDDGRGRDGVDHV